MLKIPCYPHALEAFRHFSEDGIETFCTTVFSLNQAAAVASAGVDHILPFCEPVKEMGGDPTQLIRECAAMFKQWQRRPLIMAALGAVGGDHIHGAAGRRGRGGDLLVRVPRDAPAFADGHVE